MGWFVGSPKGERREGDGDCTDRLIDPEGKAPDIWFQPAPEGNEFCVS